jgi:hypothetical protein
VPNEKSVSLHTVLLFFALDGYVRDNNRWLIAKRRSVFDWEDKRELGR